MFDIATMEMVQAFENMPPIEDMQVIMDRPRVEPVDGGSSACGAVFQVKGREIFVSRRWQAWNGAFWYIIDLTSPMTGYIGERRGGIILKLMKDENGNKISITHEDEETLYKYFTSIVEKEVNRLQQQFPFRLKVEIIRLYRPVQLDGQTGALGMDREACVA